MDVFTAPNLEALCLERGMRLPSETIGHLVTALKVGKHVALTGPPGTGKTTLAYLAAELANRALLCSGSVAVTASREWDTSVTIGRYQASREGVFFQPGVFLSAVQAGHWLLVDELNRADFDQAFGPLFTVLAGQPVTLPFKLPGHELPLAIVPPDCEAPPDVESIRVPAPWRIIATMNVFDKELLFRLSHALMRRFAFVEVPAPPDDVVGELLPPGGEAVAELFAVRRYVDLGPAVFLDAARFAAARTSGAPVSRSRLLYEVFTSYFAPQLDTLSAADGSRLLDDIGACFVEPEWTQVVRTVASLCGIQAAAPAAPVP